MTKKLLFFLVLLNFYNNVVGQCTYTGTPLTQVGSPIIFCIDNTNTQLSATVNSGQYILVNVVKGFSYTFSVGDVFTPGVTENLTILKATDNSLASTGSFSSGGAGTSITWVATFSGQVKVLLSRGSCLNNNDAGGAITATLNSIGNTQDSQIAFGTDSWVAHIYNWSGGAPPGVSPSPAAPATTTPFSVAEYVGYYNIASETINEGFGGDNACFPVLSAGANRTSIYTDTFAVRYRMRSTKTGCYLINLTGDDGMRLYVDNVLVFDRWITQPPTSYNNVLVYLNGASNIVFEYYENLIGNTANFSMTPFVASSNTVTPATATVCSGVSPGVLDGSAYTYSGSTANPSIAYQWQE